MILVMMEGHVTEDCWDDLQRAYADAMTHCPDTILLSLLTHDSHDPTVWRVLTVWESQEALETYYESGGTMPSTYAFHQLGIVPVGTPSDVVAYV